ncbi:ArsR/SmtB family transcription factor [Paludisphaera rhizosphaerae]|uniref:ArsR/SmtB family transcription factor n=1 Tax=Paludisphaera rhizosphaerae TaxID=2711216 RepID=UPI0013EC5164|nr:metalloregulator ArsR/SmtB family transcription factor [Paludisphaera rhizosphaerae]
MAVAKAVPKASASKSTTSKAAAPKASTPKAAAPKASAPKAVGARAKSVKAVDHRFQQAKRASILLKHVSDPTRLQVILILAEGERHVGALCSQLSQSQPAVSHHLALLRHGNIIAPRRQGKNNFYSLTETGAELARVVKNLIA